MYFDSNSIQHNNKNSQIKTSKKSRVSEVTLAKSRIGRIIYNFKFRSFLYCFQYGRSGKPTSV